MGQGGQGLWRQGRLTLRALGFLSASWAVCLGLLTLCPVAVMAQGRVLPPSVEAALATSKLPADALSVLVVDAQAGQSARLSHRADVAVNPASVMKLVTTYAGLDILRPDFTWRTPVYFDGPVRDGVLRGNLVIQGQGDPKLVVEHLQALLQRVQSLGVTRVTGDIVLDRSAFNVPDGDPAAFDGEPLRPYNAAPDALLLNFKSVLYTFTPDRASGMATVRFEPPLANVEVPAKVPLQAGVCNDYRNALRADFSDPNRVVFQGAYPGACGERTWPVLYGDARTYATRVVEGMWAQLGGQLQGKVRYGQVPVGAVAAFEHTSPPLTDVVRDINKFSNNVMAQQLFLRLGSGSFEASRSTVSQWWARRWPAMPAPLLENGSGLSRVERINARSLAAMLQTALGSDVGMALRDSLPIAGLDGTLRQSKARRAAGQAWLKTGSLRDVMAVAGYVRGESGQFHVLVAIVNHPTSASAARPVLDALIDWTCQDVSPIKPVALANPMTLVASHD